MYVCMYIYVYIYVYIYIYIYRLLSVLDAWELAQAHREAHSQVSADDEEVEEKDFRATCAQLVARLGTLAPVKLHLRLVKLHMRLGTWSTVSHHHTECHIIIQSVTSSYTVSHHHTHAPS